LFLLAGLIASFAAGLIAVYVVEARVAPAFARWLLRTPSGRRLRVAYLLGLLRRFGRKLRGLRGRETPERADGRAHTAGGMRTMMIIVTLRPATDCGKRCGVVGQRFASAAFREAGWRSRGDWVLVKHGRGPVL